MQTSQSCPVSWVFSAVRRTLVKHQTPLPTGLVGLFWWAQTQEKAAGCQFDHSDIHHQMGQYSKTKTFHSSHFKKALLKSSSNSAFHIRKNSGIPFWTYIMKKNLKICHVERQNTRPWIASLKTTYCPSPLRFKIKAWSTPSWNVWSERGYLPS